MRRLDEGAGGDFLLGGLAAAFGVHLLTHLYVLPLGGVLELLTDTVASSLGHELILADLMSPLFLFLLGLSPLHDEIKRGQSLANQVAMQHKQPRKQHSKHHNHSPDRPPGHHPSHIPVPLPFAPQNHHGHHKHSHISQCRSQHPNERLVVLPPNAVVDPDAVVVEVMHAAVAELAVAGGGVDVAAAVLAVEALGEFAEDSDWGGRYFWRCGER